MAIPQPLPVARMTRSDGFLRDNRGTLIGCAIFVAFVAIVPFTATTSMMNIAVFAMIFALPAIGLNLLMGLGGQVSLGQAAFFAVGGYTHAILLTKFHLPGLVAASAGVVAAMLVALLVGLPLMRLHGHYLALGHAGTRVHRHDRGARVGLHRTNHRDLRHPAAGDLRDHDQQQRVLLLVRRALRPPRHHPGHQPHAQPGRPCPIRDQRLELAAESLGVSTYALRLKVFVLSAAFAGIGGVFYAYQVAIVSPETAGFEVSVELLLMVVIGGLGSVWGALAGAFLITLLGDGMRDLIPAIIPGATGEVQLLGYGIVLILAILLLPGGLHQAAVALWRKVSHGRSRAAPPLR